MKSHYTFSCKSDITEHDWCQVCLDFITPPFHFWGGGGGGKGRVRLHVGWVSGHQNAFPHKKSN